uniref:Cilia- and flagella-associated protein 97 n=1 Tax=Sarcophilus harrisii TaxID=9305 RepID=A0A7N4PYY9_SARHA
MKFCVKVTPLSEEGKGPIKRFKMHRPCCPLFNYFDNIICQKSWERAYRDHRRKVETAKATVDCGPPVIYNHVQLNLKKFKKDAERLRFIDRENRWLMERIAFIMRTQDACDILNDYRLRWWDRRERELRRIDRENRSFQERLVSCLHWYHFHRWWEDWQLEDSFSDTLTEIPQTCCCSHLVHEIRPRRMTPRKRLLKLRQRRVETWDSDVEDEAISEDCKMKKGLDDNLMEEKAKKFSTKDEEELINKALKGQEKRKYEINQEEMDELGSRLLQDVKLRVAKLEIELETESRMLQEVKTMILLKEQEEAAGQLRKRDSKSRKSVLKEKEDAESKAKEDGKEEDGEAKPTEGGESKPEDADPKAEGADPTEGAAPNPTEGGDSNPMEGGEGGEPKPMERTDPKPMERTDSKSMSEPKPMERTDSKSMSEPKPMERTESKSMSEPKPMERTESKSMSEPKPMERTESKSMSEPKPMERTESKSMSEPKPMERTESKSMSEPKPMERTESKLMDRGEEREVPKPREREPKPREREMREPKPREREESETRRVTLVEPGKEGEERDESSAKLASEGEENASLDRTASQPPESSQEEPQDTS